MNFTKKALIAVVSATAGVLSLASGSWAGEGAAAGGAAFTIGAGGTVQSVAVGAVIGKQNVLVQAYSVDSPTGNDTNGVFAQGSAGVLNATGVNNNTGGITVGTVTLPDSALGTAQANSFTSATTVQIGTASPNNVVRIGQ